MSSDGVNSYTWDRANRLLSMGGVDYQYDGQGRRVQQTVSSTVTKYLLDIQPGLSVVLSETTGSDVVRNVHAPKGIHARKDASSNWHWLMQDGLGSVRAEVSNSITLEGSQNFAPYGSSVDALGDFGTYGFTGEPTDANGLVYDRARYYVPSIGMFASLDPFEGIKDEPMSINGYSYVHGNPVNWTDPDGKFPTIFGGAFIGAIAGAVTGGIMYGLATSGACGDNLKKQMECAGLGNAILSGAVMGAITGALIGAFGPAAAGISSLIGFGTSVYDARVNGLNICNGIGIVSSIIGGFTSTGSFQKPSFGPGSILQPVGGYPYGGITIPGITWSPPIAFPAPIVVGPSVVGVVVGGGNIMYSSDTNFRGDTYSQSPDGKYRKIYVTGKDGNIGQDMAEFDNIDTNGQGQFTEDKTGFGLRDPDGQTNWLKVNDWIQKFIIHETSQQIHALQNGLDTRPFSGERLPRLDWFRNIKNFIFEIDVVKNDPELRLYIDDNGVKNLRDTFGNQGYNFRIK